ncbi:hypothetical protein SUDANB6_02629 [Streptomyces sp. enrichment culture]
MLRPGGALALWWNTAALDVPWIAEEVHDVVLLLTLAPSTA